MSIILLVIMIVGIAAIISKSIVHPGGQLFYRFYSREILDCIACCGGLYEYQLESTRNNLRQNIRTGKFEIRRPSYGFKKYRWVAVDTLTFDNLPSLPGRLNEVIIINDFKQRA